MPRAPDRPCGALRWRREASGARGSISTGPSTPHAFGLPPYRGDDAESFTRTQEPNTCATCPVNWTREGTCLLGCSWKVAWRASGQLIEGADLFIVAMALVHDMRLVTHKRVPIARISGFQVED
jgi:hypothetical protein